jgi:antitoxin component of MazEF toxin-antitoxin module
VQVKIEKIGEGFGLVLPKELLEACGFGSEATVTVRDKSLIVTPQPRRAREGWAKALVDIPQEDLDRDFAELQAFRETPNEWDETEWQALNDFHHCFPRQHAGNVMGDGGHDFAAAAGGQVGKDEVNNRSPNVSERVAVEEEERGAAMALPQQLYGFGKGSDFELELAPLCFNRSIAL